MGADVPEPAWGRGTVRTSLWVETLGRGCGCFCWITLEDRSKFGKWRQRMQKKILATRCH